MTSAALRRITTMTYGDGLATDERVEGPVPVMSSGGVTGTHNQSNTGAPVIVVGRKGTHGSVWWSETPAFVIDTAYWIDRSNTNVHLRWLYYVLQSLSLGELNNDVGVPGLRREAVYEATVNVRSPEEQRRIADFLDDHVALIDQVIAARFEQSVKTKALHAAELQDLVHHGITTYRPLQSLTDPHRPIQYGIVLPGPDFEGGVPIIKGGDIGSGRLAKLELNRTDPEIEKAYLRSRVHPGDFVIAIRGSVGEVAQIPAELRLANLTQDSARIAPSGCDPSWLQAALESSGVQADIARLITGATVKGINIGDLRRVPIPTPDARRQAQIGLAARRLRRRSAERADALGKSVGLLKEYKQSLITAAVTGDLDVTAAGSGMPQ